MESKGRRLQSTYKRAWILAALVFCVVLIPPACGFFYIGMDSIRSDYGYLSEFKRTLMQEGFPWISRYSADEPVFGLPPLGALYPPFWVAAAIPSVEWGYSIFVAIHLAIAAFGGVLLARSFGLSKTSQVGCGLTLVLAGSTLDLLKHGQSFLISTWILVGWAFMRFGIRGGWDCKSWFGSIVAGASILLGGDPQSFMVFAGIGALECLVQVNKPFGRRALGVGSLFLAFGIAWAHWGVAWSLLEGSTRRGGLTLDEASRLSHDWVSHFAMFFSGLLEVPAFNQFGIGALAQNRSGILAGTATLSQWNNSPYIGTLLFSFAAGTQFPKHMRTVLILAIGFYLLSLGEATPVFSWLWRFIPGFGLFRYPQKYLLYSHWCVLLLAVFGFEKAKRIGYVSKRIRGVAIAMAVLSGVGALSLWLLESPIQEKVREIGIAITGKPTPWIAPVAHQIAMMMLSASALTIAILYITNRTLKKRWSISILLVELVFALPSNVLIGPPLVSLAKPWFTDALTENDTLCHSYGAFTFFCNRDTPESWESDTNPWNEMFIHGITATRGISPLYHIRVGQKYSQLESMAELEADREALLGKKGGLLSLGCTHLLALKTESQSLFSFKELTPIQNPHENQLTSYLQLYKVNQPTPLAFELTDAGALTDKILSYSRIVGHHIEIKLAAGSEATIGTHVQFHQGWRAYLNQKQIPLVLIRGILMGANVNSSKEQRTLTFDYQPPHLLRSLMISLIALIISIGIGVKWINKTAAKQPPITS